MLKLEPTLGHIIRFGVAGPSNAYYDGQYRRFYRVSQRMALFLSGKAATHTS